MKLIILINCLFFGMSISSSLAGGTMEKPSWFRSIKKSAQIEKIEQLNTNKKMKNFYQEVSIMIKDIVLPADQLVTSRQLEDYLYLRYLVTSAPLIDTNNDENIEWMMNTGNLDLKVKSRIMELMSPKIFDRPDFKAIYPVPKKETIDFFNETQALLIKQFKGEFNPDIESWKKEQKQNYEKNSRLYLDRNSSFKYFNAVNIKALRNILIKDIIEKQEKYFVEDLVEFYPKSGNKAIGFMEKAGYEKTDMPELIDRTEGRSKKTEYIRKILPKKNK